MALTMAGKAAIAPASLSSEDGRSSARGIA